MKENIEVNAEIVQGCSDFVKHEVNASGSEGLLSFGFWQRKNVFGGFGQHSRGDLVDVCAGIAIFWGILLACCG